MIDIKEFISTAEEKGALSENANYAKKGNIVLIYTPNTKEVLPPYAVGRIIHCFDNYLVYEIKEV